MIRIAALRTTSPVTLCLGTHPGIIQSILDYDYSCGRRAPSIVAIMAQGRKRERYFWGETEITLPVFASYDDLGTDARRVTCLLNVQSARRVLASTAEAFQKLPNVKAGVIFAEQTPELHAQKLRALAGQKGVLLVGLASVGILIPGKLKLGAIGGTQHPQLHAAKIFEGGDTAVVSTSGGIVNELIHTVTGSGLRVSFAMALGGDRFPITSPADAFLLAQADRATKRIVYFGELGGADEYELAELIRAKKVTKEVVAYIAGTVADLFETPPQFGHAKAMAQSHVETAAAKKEALKAVGVTVCERFGDMAPLLAKRSAPVAANKNVRYIGERRRRLILSHVSGDKNGDVHLLGRNLLHTVERHSLASLVFSMLLNHDVQSKRLVGFTDYVLRSLVDHGPYVSGATNTIIAARAGKDLVSSLASGLLTIGPRFGGALNDAAGHWLHGVQQGIDPKEFVSSFTGRGGIIPGIGHKKYRVDSPDPRLHALEKFSGNTNGDRYLAFARAVEQVTLAKKGNLILNVDGAIAAMLLDLIESELKYSPKQLKELVEIEFFNALFVLSRSVGFAAHYLDQRRHDEGLLRLSDQEIGYAG